jgi:hypothetical protein
MRLIRFSRQQPGSIHGRALAGLVRTLPPAWPAWWSGPSFLRWTFRTRPARKSPRSRVGSNTSRPWRSRDVLPRQPRNLLRRASADAAQREQDWVGLETAKGSCADLSAQRSYDGRAGFETGESRNASGGKLPFWRCVPSNQAHSTTSFPSAVMPMTVTVIRGLPDFNWTVSPILKPIAAPKLQPLIKLAACPIINTYDAPDHGQFATCMDHRFLL